MVRVAQVDIRRRHINLVLVEEPEGLAGTGEKGKRRKRGANPGI
jgi:hypothetical protein